MAGRLTGGIGRWAGIAAAGAAGCSSDGGGSEDTADPTDGGAVVQCEEAVFIDLAIVGNVTDGDAPAAAGVAVRIEEREYAPGLAIHGETVTNAGGTFSMQATQMPIVDGCLGWAMGFFVVADDGTRVAEWPINSVISGAWQDGEDSADLTGLPLDLAN